MNKNGELAMDKNILVFDFETTDVDKETARICQFSWVLFDGPTGQLLDSDMQYVNPAIPIKKGATEVHGITNDQVSDKPTFDFFAGDLQNLFESDVIISGYNNRAFDDVIAEKEFARVGRNVSLLNKPNIDVFKYFKKVFPSSLAGLVRLFFGEDMKDAHGAKADVLQTHRVFREVYRRCGHDFPETASGINDYLYGDVVDREGNLKWNEDGRAIFTFGKRKGDTLREVASTDANYLNWMLGQNFPEDFKQYLRDGMIGKFPVKEVPA